MKTGAALRRWFAGPANDDIVCFHSVIVPGKAGGRGDIDHVLVAGNSVVLIDTKVWKPATYWSVRGRLFRGTRRFADGEHTRLHMMTDKVTEMFPDAVITRVMVVHSSRARADIRVGGVALPKIITCSASTAELTIRASLDRRTPPNRPLLQMLHRHLSHA